MVEKNSELNRDRKLEVVGIVMKNGVAGNEIEDVIENFGVDT